MNNEPPLGKNYWIALGLSMLVLMVYPFILKKTSPPPDPAAVVDQIEYEQKQATGQKIVHAVDSIAKNLQGNVSELPVEAKTVQFENNFYSAELSNLGATISNLHYKGPQGVTDKGTSFYQTDPWQSQFLATRFLHDSTDLSRTLYQVNKERVKEGIIEFVYEKANEYRVLKRYQFSSVAPAISLDLEIENLSARAKHFPTEILYGMNYELEKSHDAGFVEAVAKLEKVKKANVNKVAKKGFKVEESSAWSGLIKKYFALLVRPDTKTISAEFSGNGEDLMEATVRLEPLSIPAGGKANQNIFIYAGSQRYEVLKSFDYGLEALMTRGFLGTIRVWLFIALNFFYGFTHNYGWAIIILTLIIKGAFTPLTHMSFENMKKMQVIQPKLKSLQERYKGDPNKLNQEMMQLYRRNKINPMMGCLPMLLQIPIFIAFYQALSGAIELKGAPFIFWITDLSEPDRLFTMPFTIPMIGNGINVLPVLMIFSMAWQQKLTPTATASPEQAKIMAWMPYIFGVMFYAMPSGLVLYWFVNNILSIIHQVFIKRIKFDLHHEDQD